MVVHEGSSRSECRAANTAAVGLGVLAATFFGTLAWYGLNLGEDGGTIHLFYRTANGETPYLDFISGYTPAYFYFHAWLLRTFGESVVSVRIPLAVVHSANVVLLFRIGRSLLPVRWALVPALAYMAALPVVEASECSFNVPYPAWYTLALLLIGWFPARAAAKGHAAWGLLAGALAGLSFAFKPNSGLFHLGFVVLLVATLGPAVASRGRLDRWTRRLALMAVLGGVLIVLRNHWQAKELSVFFVPLLLTVAAAWVRWTQDPPAPIAARNGIFAVTVTTVLGFALVSLPWLARWWWLLGTERFVRDVLFIGAGYEKVFFEAYRSSLSRLAVASVSVALLWWVSSWRSLICRRVVLWITVAGALVGSAWMWWRATLPEGLVAALVSAFQDAAFLVIPVAHACGALCIWHQRNAREGVGPALTAVAIAAQCSWLNAYPRSDYFHVAYSAPLTGILLVYVSRQIGGQLATAAPVLLQRFAQSAAWIGVVVLLSVVALPQAKLVSKVWMTFAGRESGLAWFDVDRALVLIQAGPSGQRQRDLAQLVTYLRSVSDEREWLFAFPDLEVVTFLAALRSPARIGYFKAGWPDHSVEAEVVDALEERVPRWVVTEDPVSLFFFDSPAYFFLLRQWVLQHYRPRARFGSFVLFERAEAPASEPTVFAPPANSVQSAESLQCSKERFHQLRRLGDRQDARVWARIWAEGGYRSWDESCGTLALRVLGETGDAYVARALFSAPPALDRLEVAWEGALWSLTLRGLLRPFHWAAEHEWVEQRNAWEGLSGGEQRLLEDWLQSNTRPQRRLFAAWALSRSGAVGGLRTPEGDNALDVLLRAVLATAGKAGAADWADILIWEPFFPTVLPALFLEWAGRTGDAGFKAVRTTWERSGVEVRETLAYLLAVLADPDACSWLAERGKEEQPARVSRAVQWTRRRLNRLGVCTRDLHSR